MVWDCTRYATCRDHAKFLADMRLSIERNFRINEAPFSHRPRIIDAPYFSWDMVTLDWMHDADMGVVPAEIGEIWVSLLPGLASPGVGKLGKLAGKMKVRNSGLKNLKTQLRVWYSVNNTKSQIPVGRLTLRKSKIKKHPKLKCKAAQARNLVSFTESLAEDFRGKDGAFGENRYQSIWYLARICELARKRELSKKDLDQWRLYSAYHMYLRGQNIRDVFCVSNSWAIFGLVFLVGILTPSRSRTKTSTNVFLHRKLFRDIHYKKCVVVNLGYQASRANV